MVIRWVLFQTGPYCRVTDEERRRDLACSFPCGRKDDRRDLIENKRAFTLHYVPSALRRVLAVWCLLRDQIQRNAPKIPLLITFHEKKKKISIFPLVTVVEKLILEVEPKMTINQCVNVHVFIYLFNECDLQMEILFYVEIHQTPKTRSVKQLCSLSSSSGPKYTARTTSKPRPLCE